VFLFLATAFRPLNWRTKQSIFLPGVEVLKEGTGVNRSRLLRIHRTDVGHSGRVKFTHYICRPKRYSNSWHGCLYSCVEDPSTSLVIQGVRACSIPWLSTIADGVLHCLRLTVNPPISRLFHASAISHSSVMMTQRVMKIQWCHLPPIKREATYEAELRLVSISQRMQVMPLSCWTPNLRKISIFSGNFTKNSIFPGKFPKFTKFSIFQAKITHLLLGRLFYFSSKVTTFEHTSCTW